MARGTRFKSFCTSITLSCVNQVPSRCSLLQPQIHLHDDGPYFSMSYGSFNLSDTSFIASSFKCLIFEERKPAEDRNCKSRDCWNGSNSSPFFSSFFVSLPSCVMTTNLKQTETRWYKCSGMDIR